MLFQTVVDPKTMTEKVFRVVRNSTTETSTVTIAAGTPLILQTATASADGSWVAQAITSTSVVNNLWVGNAHAALAAGAIGLAQCYGMDDDAVVVTAGASAGAVLIPEGATLVTVGTTITPGINTAAAVAVLVAPSGAASAATKVFLRLL